MEEEDYLDKLERGAKERGCFLTEADCRRVLDYFDARIETIERMESALMDIRSWSRSYPVSVFPEPDLKMAALVLKAAGLSLDAISADAMRNVLAGVQALVKDGLSEPHTPP